MKPAIRLERFVVRDPLSCHRCNYPRVPYDSAYSPTIGGVALAVFCSSRCAEWHMTAPLRVEYA